MPYAPRTTDRSGEILAGGINQGVGGLLAGIMQAAKIKSEGNKLAELLQGLGMTPEQIANKTPDQLQGMLDAKLTGSKLASTEATTRGANAQAGYYEGKSESERNTGEALAAALAGLGAQEPGSPVQMMREVAADGGNVGDPRVAALLDALKKPEAPFEPSWLTGPDGMLAMTTSSKSAVPLQAPRGAKPATQQVQVGGRNYVVGPGNRYLDADTGQPVDFSPSVPRAPDPLMRTMDPELYDAQRTEYLRYVQGQGGGGQASAPAAGGGAPTAPSAPVVITSQAEFDKLQRGDAFIYNGRQGVKK